MKDYIEVQIGTSVYSIETEEDLIATIKSIVIYERGNLDTLKVNNISDEWREWNKDPNRLLEDKPTKYI